MRIGWQCFLVQDVADEKTDEKLCILFFQKKEDTLKKKRQNVGEGRYV